MAARKPKPAEPVAVVSETDVSQPLIHYLANPLAVAAQTPRTRDDTWTRSTPSMPSSCRSCSGIASMAAGSGHRMTGRLWSALADGFRHEIIKKPPPSGGFSHALPLRNFAVASMCIVWP